MHIRVCLWIVNSPFSVKMILLVFPKTPLLINHHFPMSSARHAPVLILFSLLPTGYEVQVAQVGSSSELQQQHSPSAAADFRSGGGGGGGGQAQNIFGVGGAGAAGVPLRGSGPGQHRSVPSVDNWHWLSYPF